jgi:hypothetical protein
MIGLDRKKIGCALALAAAFLMLTGTRAPGNELRVSSLGNPRIALVDEDNQINPYDFGRNPAYLLNDFELSWSRFSLGGRHESGDVLRPYDPREETLAFGTATGRIKLGERHAIWGGFRYHGLWQYDVHRSLEHDSYHDPFYLTDLTTGDFEYFGPSTAFDYSLRLTEKLYIGAGFDYSLSTGLKQQYTQPEIVRNYLRGNLGVIYQLTSSWALGAVARPVRLQNRTEFAKTEEGLDNIIHRFYGDDIFDVRAFSSTTIREVLWGVDAGVQSFIMTDRLQLGAVIGYGLHENDLRYGTSRREHYGFWQSTTYDFQFISRYTPAGSPLTLGLRGRVLRVDGWAKRPEFDDVLLYDNPLQTESFGGGLTFRLPPAGPLLAAEYVLNHFDVTVNDYGAKLYRHLDVIQNIARLGVEYDLFGLHSIRAGVEATDFLVDRQLKLPPNVDRYRFSGGFRYRTGFWDIETQLLYDYVTQATNEWKRDGLGFVVWFSHI